MFKLKSRPGMAAIVGTLMAFGGLAIGAQPAIADTSQISSDDLAQIEGFFDANGVPEATQQALLDKLASGETWNSMDGSAPVSTTTTSTDTVQKTISVFADGSILVDELELPPAALPGGISAFSVGTCQSAVTGSGYANRYDCKASMSTAIMTMGFYISYSLIQGGYDQILEVHSPYRSVLSGSSTSPSLTLVKPVENSSGSAWAKITSTYTGFAGAPSATYEMRALVGQDTAWTRWERKGAE